MKAFVLPVSIALAAFVAGVSCALYVATFLKRDAQHAYITSYELWQFDAKIAASEYLSNIDLAQRGKTEAIIRVNCLLLLASTRKLAPQAFGPNQEADVHQFLERSNATISSLSKQDLCGIPGHPPQ